MIFLPQRFVQELRLKPETRMGSQIVSVILSDGKRYDKVLVVEGRISSVGGMDRIPFSTDEIVEVILTHEK
jgi:hypothetical protein